MWQNFSIINKAYLCYECKRPTIRFLCLIQTFLSALIDVAGHAGKLDAAFEILQDARKHGKRLGTISYSSLMGACSNVCPVIHL